jgi:hypothetical protein
MRTAVCALGIATLENSGSRSGSARPASGRSASGRARGAAGGRGYGAAACAELQAQLQAQTAVLDGLTQRREALLIRQLAIAMAFQATAEIAAHRAACGGVGAVPPPPTPFGAGPADGEGLEGAGGEPARCATAAAALGDAGMPPHLREGGSLLHLDE